MNLNLKTNDYYKDKYLKYKKKYLELKNNNQNNNNQIGGNIRYVYDDNLLDLTNFNLNFRINIYAICFDSNKIYFTNFSSTAIFEYDLDTNLIRYPIDNLGLNNPKDIKIYNNEIYVADTGNHKIKIFDLSFNLNRSFGGFGTEDGKLKEPNGIFIYNEQIYVADTNNKRIQVFSLDGDFIRVINLNAPNFNNRIKPINLLINNDEIYLIPLKSYLNSSLVMKFSLDGNFINHFGSNNNIIINNLNNPHCLIKIDNYIAVTDDNSFSIYTINGSFINKYLIRINNYHFYGITYNPISNLIYVVDSDNNIQQFSRIPEVVQESQPVRQVQASQIVRQVQSSQPLTLEQIINNININYRNSGQSVRIIIKCLVENDLIKFNFSYEENGITKKNDIFTSLFNFRQTLFTPNAYLTFNFENYSTGQILPTADAGGPRKTVFLRLSQLFNDSTREYFNLFISDTETGFINLVSTCEKSELQKIKFLGSLFGLALRLKVNIFISLDPLLLYQMINDDLSTLSYQQIQSIINDFNPSLLRKYPYICLDENNWRTISSCKYDLDFNEIEITENDEENLRRIRSATLDKIRESTVNNTRYKQIYSNFITGFRQVINIDLIGLRGAPIKTLNLLIAGQTDISLESILNNAVYKNFGDNNVDDFNGDDNIDDIDIETNVVKIEKINFLKTIIQNNYDDASYLFIDNYNTNENLSITEKYIKEIVEDAIRNNITPQDLYIKKLLECITGGDNVPPLGFDPKIKFKLLRFHHPDIITSSHTCFNKLEINKDVFESLFLLRDNMEAVKDNLLYNEFKLEELIKASGNYNAG